VASTGFGSLVRLGPRFNSSECCCNSVSRSHTGLPEAHNPLARNHGIRVGARPRHPRRCSPCTRP
jgi:hypothetical protein